MILDPAYHNADLDDEICVAIHPRLHIVDPAGHHRTLLASIYSPDRRAWTFQILDCDGHTTQVCSLLGYRILGLATTTENISAQPPTAAA